MAWLPARTISIYLPTVNVIQYAICSINQPAKIVCSICKAIASYLYYHFFPFLAVFLPVLLSIAGRRVARYQPSLTGRCRGEFVTSLPLWRPVVPPTAGRGPLVSCQSHVTSPPPPTDTPSTGGGGDARTGWGCCRTGAWPGGANPVFWCVIGIMNFSYCNYEE